MLTLLKILAAVAVISGVVSEGLETQPGQLLWLWRRPWLLFKSVVAALVLVPAVAVSAVIYLNLPKLVEVAMVLLSISPAPPLVMRAAWKSGGDRDFGASLQITLALLAVASLPATLWLLGLMFPAKAYIAPWEVAWVIFKMLLFPLLVSLVVRKYWPALASRLAGPLARFSIFMMIAVALLILTLAWRIVLSVGWSGAAGIIGFTWAAVALGWILGGPERVHRMTLAVFCATRHAGLAMLIAVHSFPKQGISQMVVACLVVSALALLATRLLLRRALLSGRST